MTTQADGRSLWFPVVAPPAAWSAQELIGWGIGEQACGLLSTTAVRSAVLVITIAALIVSIGGIVSGWRMWTARSDAASPLETDAAARAEFIALAGTLISGVFTLAIVWAGLSAAFVWSCGRIR